MVLSGSHLNCTRPGTFHLERVAERTPEGRTMHAENIGRSSARGRILWNQMYQRLRQAAARAAQRCGTDCIVSEGGIREARGLPVVDVTDELIESLQ